MFLKLLKVHFLENFNKKIIFIIIANGENHNLFMYGLHNLMQHLHFSK
ncbi:hypothetical protein Aazo_1271 ['Nostoc azollae' 0708]|uniref:Uncharacterized protein n=1 Tax=Nostoc azollae (strain 0708) TaxID=551115 RepID=D7E3E0_NOSA0|nr:hypothetical protein Aazo_1271 ['Nostoc azollae' 0708]